MKKAIAYARYSPRPHGEHCDSVEKQLADIREYCARMRYELVGEYSDKALSGADDERPGLADAIDACKRGQGYILVVRSLDRLARGNALTEGILLAISARGASLETLDGLNTNTETAEQELLRVIMQGLSQFQRRKTRETTSRRMKQHMANGRAMSHLLPYGYRDAGCVQATDAQGKPIERRIMAPDDAEQTTIRQMAELKTLGLGPRAIARRLNQDGMTLRGRPFKHSSIIRILRREQERAKSGI
jgi:site-specific DNA recombinase